MNVSFGNLRYLARRVWRSWSFSVLAISIIAVGVALATTMFNVVNGLVLRGVPYADGDRLVHIRTVNQKTGESWAWMPVRYFEELREIQTSFETLAGHDSLRSLVLSGPEGPERLPLNRVTASFLEAL